MSWEKKFWGKDLCNLLGMEKGGHSRFSATDLGVKLVGWIWGTEGGKKACKQPTWFSVRCGLWVIRGWADGLGKQEVEGERLEREDLWNLQESGLGGRDGCHVYFAAEQVIRQVD